MERWLDKGIVLIDRWMEGYDIYGHSLDLFLSLQGPASIPTTTLVRERNLECAQRRHAEKRKPETNFLEMAKTIMLDVWSASIQSVLPAVISAQDQRGR